MATVQFEACKKQVGSAISAAIAACAPVAGLETNNATLVTKFGIAPQAKVAEKPHPEASNWLATAITGRNSVLDKQAEEHPPMAVEEHPHGAPSSRAAGK